MKTRMLKISALCLGLGLTFSASGTISMAAEVSDSADLIGTTGFAQCSEYVNVRASADQEGDVIGKLYNNGSVEILDVDEHGWYHIRSGNVEGYVAGTYIATGQEAQEIAASSGYTTAEVGAETLNVRSLADESAEVVGAAAEAEKLEVVEDTGDWVKVVLDNGVYGYVSAEYVCVSTEYPTALTLEEDAARQAQLTASEPSSAEASEPIYEESYAEDTSTDEPAYTESAGTDSDYTETVPEEVYTDTSSDQAYTDTEDSYADTGDTYTDPVETEAVYTDDSVSADTYTDTAGTDASYTDSTASENTYTEEAYTENTDTTEDSSADGTYTEDSHTDDTYTEDSNTDDSYTEETSAEDTSASESNSALGQQIADYACQFVGNPYVWGGTSLTSGADCSGFVLSVFANFGISLPHSAAAQAGYGYEVSYSDLIPGDLLFYSDGSGISHVAIYIGGGSIVHAANSSSGICISGAGYSTPVSCRRLV